MSKILTNINEFSTKYSGLLSLLQILTPAILIACFYVFTLYMNANFVNRPEYDTDKEKSEKVFEEIRGKLNLLIVGQSAFSVQMSSFQNSITDHAERLRYLERRESMVKR